MKLILMIILPKTKTRNNKTPRIPTSSTLPSIPSHSHRHPNQVQAPEVRSFPCWSIQSFLSVRGGHCGRRHLCHTLSVNGPQHCPPFILASFLPFGAFLKHIFWTLWWQEWLFWVFVFANLFTLFAVNLARLSGYCFSSKRCDVKVCLAFRQGMETCLLGVFIVYSMEVITEYFCLSS